MPASVESAARPRGIVRNEALSELKTRVHEELIHELDPAQLVGDLSFTSPARRAVEQAAEERIALADPISGARSACGWPQRSPTKSSGTVRSSHCCAIRPLPR